MGKTGKWFRSFLGGSKKSEQKKKKQKGVIKSDNYVGDEGDPQGSPYVHGGLDANRHAIAVAAATAAVAEAALAAAQAAAEVVRMTSGGGSVRGYGGGERRRVAAAVKIQSGFRAYLARRALKALKGLVKLQALVRGHIVRRQSADMLRRMQAMARIQARASANRAHISDSSNPKIKGFENIRKYEQRSGSAKNVRPVYEQYNSRSRNSNNVNKEFSHKPFDWLDHWMQQCKLNDQQNTLLQTGCGDDERNDKILEIDTWKPRQNPRSRNDRSIPTSHYFSAWNEMGQEYTRTGSLSRLSAKLEKPNPSISSEEVSSIMSSKYPPEGDSPRVHSAMSRPTGNARTPFTPARSECSRSLFGDYLGHPSYMAYTESSRAKVRSQSAPKQRMQLEELGLSSKFGRSLWESDTISEKGSILPDKDRSNAYLQSGQYKRQGAPVYHGAFGLNTSYGH